MLYSRLIMKTKYDWIQITTSLLCILFGTLFAGLDFTGDSLKGDLMALGGAISHATSTTLGELFNNNRDPVDWVSKMGLSGLLLAFTCMLIFEIDEIRRAPWQGMLLFLGYGLCNIIYFTYGYRLIKNINAIYFMIPALLAPLLSFPIDCIFFGSHF